MSAKMSGIKADQRRHPDQASIPTARVGAHGAVTAVATRVSTTSTVVDGSASSSTQITAVAVNINVDEDSALGARLCDVSTATVLENCKSGV
jgi:hypothetical protein